MNSFSFVEDILEQFKGTKDVVTDIHTMGENVVVQTTKGLQHTDIKVPLGLGEQILDERGLDSGDMIGGHRCRIHVSRLGGNTSDLSIRIFPDHIRSLEECEADDSIVQLTKQRSGFIIVGGHTGARKTTLISALIDKINTDRDAVIITVEDPVEIIHKHKKGVVRHKEISDKLSWSAALRDLYRENADVLMIGETRDFEAVQAAVDLALSGKLVFTTIHAKSVEDAIRQILNRCPPDKIDLMANNLADSLTAVIVQRVDLARQFQREYCIFDSAERMMVRKKELEKITPRIIDNHRTGMAGYKAFPVEKEVRRTNGF